ncbi:hypothetical protein KUTeg_023521 [Tegillarca granosa]|uniref:Uncharacterized protein n=1 Tax=Tegillarca granosa TaxID=220873 RepID=A0ABQ9E4V4_TEGGR|nr:hypothetical protein KUTeg_023521 [Tegillarca granosa]
MYNCSACMKTFTLTYMHEQWLQYRYSIYCVQPRQLMLSKGCYTKQAAAGFVRRCYCYSNFCNAGIVVGTNCALLTVPIFIVLCIYTVV